MSPKVRVQRKEYGVLVVMSLPLSSSLQLSLLTPACLAIDTYHIERREPFDSNSSWQSECGLKTPSLFPLFNRFRDRSAFMLLQNAYYRYLTTQNASVVSS